MRGYLSIIDKTISPKTIVDVSYPLFHHWNSNYKYLL